MLIFWLLQAAELGQDELWTLQAGGRLAHVAGDAC